MLARTLVSESVLPIRRILSGLGTRLICWQEHPIHEAVLDPALGMSSGRKAPTAVLVQCERCLLSLYLRHKFASTALVLIYLY